MSQYVYTDRALALRVYRAIRKATGHPRVTPGRQWSRCPHRPDFVFSDTFDAQKTRNVGWDRDTTGPTRKKRGVEEYAIFASPEAKRVEGRTERIDGQDVQLPSAGDRRARDSSWDDADPEPALVNTRSVTVTPGGKRSGR